MKIFLLILCFFNIFIFVISLLVNNKKGYKFTKGKIISVVGQKKLLPNKTNDILAKYFKKNNTAISNLIFDDNGKNRIIISYNAENNDYYTFKSTNKNRVKRKSILLKYNKKNPQVSFFFNYKIIIISFILSVLFLILYLAL